jgi:hypothetical protein
MADFEAMKDHWSEVEDRDGIRLSWNTFPSSRMVRPAYSVDMDGMLIRDTGSFAPRRTHWRAVYTTEGEGRHTSAAV